MPPTCRTRSRHTKPPYDKKSQYIFLHASSIESKKYAVRSEFNERGWSKKDPGEQYSKEKIHIFEQMIFRALAEEYIGESKAAELMINTT
jgi:hypothetical protein